MLEYAEMPAFGKYFGDIKEQMKKFLNTFV